ncbi:MAG: hypothetical protein J4F41_05095 [Alphaproteobacteria bacterium]|nr:hypothetical protein [Alphaproteobacteria bacterium]
MQESVIGFEDPLGVASHFNPFHKHQYKYIYNYLYEIRDHLPRLFIVNQDYPRRDLPISKQSVVKDRLKVTSYKPGKIEFKAEALSNEKILISSNFSKDWSLLVNGELNTSLLAEDVFGMMSITPRKGIHEYTLIFKDSSWVIILQMLLGFGFVVVVNHLQALIKGVKRIKALSSNSGRNGKPGS